MVSTPDTHILHDGKLLPVIPGMQASVDILTGEKTVLEYILKSVTKIRDEALRENQWAFINAIAVDLILTYSDRI